MQSLTLGQEVPFFSSCTDRSCPLAASSRLPSPISLRTAVALPWGGPRFTAAEGTHVSGGAGCFPAGRGGRRLCSCPASSRGSTRDSCFGSQGSRATSPSRAALGPRVPERSLAGLWGGARTTRPDSCPEACWVSAPLPPSAGTQDETCAPLQKATEGSRGGFRCRGNDRKTRDLTPDRIRRRRGKRPPAHYRAK